jgi:hypothetical protein
MNPVFYQYHREENILDSLIHEFAKRKWLFDEMPNDYFHHYRWPDIVLSDKTAKLELPTHEGNQKKDFPYTIELIGCYQPNESPGEEGHVILFMPKVKEVALAYAKYKTGPAFGSLSDSDIEYVIELLTTLILIHEFTHWIMHCGKSPRLFNSNTYEQLQMIEYDSVDSIQFHETAAQILTNYICSKQSDLWEIFLWLSNHQPEQYNVYRELLWGDANSNNKVDDNLLSEFIGFLKNARHYDIQLFSYCKLFYRPVAIEQINDEGNNDEPEPNSYQSALKYLNLSDIFINELDVEPLELSMAISNVKSQLGHMVSIYRSYMKLLYIDDNSEKLLMRLEDAIKNNFPWILPILMDKFNGMKTGKRYGI